MGLVELVSLGVGLILIGGLEASVGNDLNPDNTHFSELFFVTGSNIYSLGEVNSSIERSVTAGLLKFGSDSFISEQMSFF